MSGGTLPCDLFHDPFNVTYPPPPVNRQIPLKTSSLDIFVSNSLKIIYVNLLFTYKSLIRLHKYL